MLVASSEVYYTTVSSWCFSQLASLFWQPTKRCPCTATQKDQNRIWSNFPVSLSCDFGRADKMLDSALSPYASPVVGWEPAGDEAELDTVFCYMSYLGIMQHCTSRCHWLSDSERYKTQVQMMALLLYLRASVPLLLKWEQWCLFYQVPGNLHISFISVGYSQYCMMVAS